MFNLLMVDRNPEDFFAVYQDTVAKATSYMTVNQEAVYHSFMLGLSMILDKNRFEVKADRETGNGRADIIIKPKIVTTESLSVVMEFKIGDDVDAAVEEAMSRIHMKNYKADLRGKILLMGIGHKLKECKMIYEWDQMPL